MIGYDRIGSDWIFSRNFLLKFVFSYSFFFFSLPRSNSLRKTERERERRNKKKGKSLIALYECDRRKMGGL